ncbi:hypothetical protein Taro_022032, partial [Colocasia esculenta]|nr:hypothetical protein [Colocasia esculenta]
LQTDGYETVCYNLKCPGFVQTNKRTTLGTTLQPVSEYGGPQYAIDVEMFKDNRTGNWWVYLQGTEMGYWAKELLPSLEQGAEFVDFGGEVLNLRSSGQHTSTEMGSGHLPYEHFRKSSFFKNVQCLNREYTYQPPNFIRDLSEKRDCYALEPSSDVSGPWGYFFYYGGAGRLGRCQ